jgi:GTPase-activating protein BEM2
MVSVNQRAIESRRLHALRESHAKMRASFIDRSSLGIADRADDIPPLLAACVAEIEKRGLREEGIYRVPGSVKDIQAILAAVGRKKSKLMPLGSIQDIHAVCGAVKQYFRDLADPLVPYDVYDQVVAMAGESEETRIARAIDIILSLWPANRHILRFLCTHLLRVVAQSEHNKMGLHNICVVFGPTLIRAREDNFSTFQNMPRVCGFLELILGRFDAIFNAVAAAEYASAAAGAGMLTVGGASSGASHL